MKNIVGHTPSTFLKSCSFQRYRLLSPIKFLLIVDFKVYGLSEGASQAFDMLVDNEGNYVMGGHTTVGDGVVNWDYLALKVNSQTKQVMWRKTFGQPRGFDAR